MRQCSLCAEWLPRGDFEGQAKDCRLCRQLEELRKPRGSTSIERALTPKGARARFDAEARRLTAESGVNYVVDHVIPYRGKLDRKSRNWVLICGLDIPSNWQVISEPENRAKWMRFRKSDAAAEEARLLSLNSNAPKDLT